MRERRETVLPEPEGHSRTALPPASSVFLRSHMYAYCSGVNTTKKETVTWVYSRVGEEDGQFVNIESTSISTWIYPDGYTSSLVFLFPPRRGDGGG